MEKIKLIVARRKKGYSQLNMAEELGIDESNYSRREKGLTKINIEEWVKLSQILSVPIENIYEDDENFFSISNDNSSGNNSYYGNNNNIYSVPEFILETQQKYIQKLEEENNHLKERLNEK